MTNETEFAGLLPCPFCGGEAEFKPYKKDGLTIKCKSFGCVRRDQRVLRQSIDWLREAMAKDWNTRTNPPPCPSKDPMKKAGKSFKFNNAFLRDGAWDVKVNGSKVTQLFMVHGA